MLNTMLEPEKKDMEAKSLPHTCHLENVQVF
jgi:hypothetical protein